MHRSTPQTIAITCHAAASLPLDSIEGFQGNLKIRTPWDIDKLIKSIKRYGFSFPFFIWKHGDSNYCLDGHGRIAALHELKRQGWRLPDFPVAYIDAQDEQEAKQKLLRENSRYGLITRESIAEFAGDLIVNYEDLSIPGEDINFAGDIFDESGEASPQNTALLTLRFLGYVIYLSDDEAGRFEAAFRRYMETTGNPEGFIASLLGLVKQ